MKNIIFLVLFLAARFCSNSQTTDPKLRSPVPTFRMTLSNGSYYSNKEVPKNKPLVLIYFAPDCEHCIKLMDALFKKIHQLDKATIVMITFEQPSDVAWFERKYQTAKYANIKVGTEGVTYVLRNYYKINKTPFTAVYDKKGRLAFSYKEETPVDEMLARSKKL